MKETETLPGITKEALQVIQSATIAEKNLSKVRSPRLYDTVEFILINEGYLSNIYLYETRGWQIWIHEGMTQPPADHVSKKRIIKWHKKHNPQNNIDNLYVFAPFERKITGRYHALVHFHGRAFFGTPHFVRDNKINLGKRDSFEDAKNLLFKKIVDESNSQVKRVNEATKDVADLFV